MVKYNRFARKPRSTDRERELEIIRILTFMSRDGWRYARPAEYLPLHRELKKLQAQAAGNALQQVLREGD